MFRFDGVHAFLFLPWVFFLVVFAAFGAIAQDRNFVRDVVGISEDSLRLLLSVLFVSRPREAAPTRSSGELTNKSVCHDGADVLPKDVRRDYGRHRASHLSSGYSLLRDEKNKKLNKNFRRPFLRPAAGADEGTERNPVRGFSPDRHAWEATNFA